MAYHRTTQSSSQHQELNKQITSSQRTIRTAEIATVQEIIPGNMLLGMYGTNVDHITCKKSTRQHN